MTHVEEFTNLTKAEVEALLECFDFLRNGYVQLINFNRDGLWIIRMRHKAKGRTLTISISDCKYVIWKDRKLSKLVAFRSSADRYRLFVNSDMSVGVVRLNAGGGQKVVPG